MPRLTFLHPDGRRQAVDADPGSSVMQAATAEALAEILAECGGNGMCATCHVYVVEDPAAALPAMTPDEDALLDGTAAPRRPNSRLSCQLPATEGLVLLLPDRQV